MNKYRSKNKEPYYLRFTLFTRWGSDNEPKIGPSTVVEYVFYRHNNNWIVINK